MKRAGTPPPGAGPRGRKGPVLITGGAGFIGTNLADRLLAEGREVIVFDNFSRRGVDRNAQWLAARHGPRVRIVEGDIRDAAAVARALRNAAQVFHFAAQVAVTSSLVDPVGDFEVNARGTLNLLEALRGRPRPAPLVFTSTNKVYGDLDDLELGLGETRYVPVNPAVRAHGVGEDRAVSFCSPYGCSKGTADQYVLDYARTFRLPAAVFRMSCIYGPHQCGTEDQGWVAHFVIRAIKGEPVTIYGDGMQVRDVLFVDDLVDAFLLAQAHMDRVGGRAFNMGGGPESTTSLLELLDRIAELHGGRLAFERDAWRAADQRYYVSDTRRFRALTGWRPRTDLTAGLLALYQWLLGAQPRPVAVAGTMAS